MTGMFRLRQLSLVAFLVVGAAGAPSSEGSGPVCESDGPLQLRPQTFDRIRIGTARAEVEHILGSPDYSPARGQDYFSTPGECEVEPGRKTGCGFVIDYRDYSANPSPDTGRVVKCRWGAIGE
jgi:hypothetical protein